MCSCLFLVRWFICAAEEEEERRRLLRLMSNGISSVVYCNHTDAVNKKRPDHVTTSGFYLQVLGLLRKQRKQPLPSSSSSTGRTPMSPWRHKAPDVFRPSQSYDFKGLVLGEYVQQRLTNTSDLVLHDWKWNVAMKLNSCWVSLWAMTSSATRRTCQL